MKKKFLVSCFAFLVAAVAVTVAVLWRGSGRGGRPRPPAIDLPTHHSLQHDCGTPGGRPLPETASDDVEPPEADEDTAEPMTAEERAEAEEERLVDAFDALTDKWQEPATNGVTMADVDAFVKQFETVPKDRKEECLQRALNLIPDENVMLLLGVLMDKTQDKELVELVFNDILNRDEDVKNPILQQILKDKSHPCWKDAAWILDVQDEEPKP